MKNISQRDAFWEKIYDMAKEDRDIIVVSEDMGAPALDRFRRDLPGQFVNVGIAEQNGILIGSGLALKGKKVYAYAIEAFVGLNCLEKIRVQNCIMNIPINIVGVGAGFGYPDSGPTHHILEDLAVMRAFPNIQVQTITDSVMSASIAESSCNLNTVNYIRLDREVFPDIYEQGTDFSQGLAIVKKSSSAYILATGNMVHLALELTKDKDIGVIDLFQLPINSEALIKAIQGVSKLISLEEHFLPGGLGSAICEVLNDKGTGLSIKRLGLAGDKGYCYKYGSREILRDYFDLGKEKIVAEINDYLAD